MCPPSSGERGEELKLLGEQSCNIPCAQTARPIWAQGPKRFGNEFGISNLSPKRVPSALRTAKRRRRPRAVAEGNCKTGTPWDIQWCAAALPLDVSRQSRFHNGHVHIDFEALVQLLLHMSVFFSAPEEVFVFVDML